MFKEEDIEIAPRMIKTVNEDGTTTWMTNPLYGKSAVSFMVGPQGKTKIVTPEGVADEKMIDEDAEDAEFEEVPDMTPSERKKEYQKKRTNAMYEIFSPRIKNSHVREFSLRETYDIADEAMAAGLNAAKEILQQEGGSFYACTLNKLDDFIKMLRRK